MNKYFKTDIYRLLSSKYFIFGMAGIALLYILGGYQAIIVTDVYMAYFYNGWFSTATLAYAFCAISFSGCFIEDSEHGFWIQEIQRGSLRGYIWSKVIVCYLGSILTMVGGILLFALILHIWLPWIPEESFLQSQRRMDTFGFLLYPQTILLYFMCSAIKSGMLGGIFSLLAAYISLYEKNRLFTICAPVVGYYFIENLLITKLRLPIYFDLWVIFGQGYTLFENKLFDVIYAMFVSAFVILFLGVMVKRKVRREVCGKARD